MTTTGPDNWFLRQIRKLICFEKRLVKNTGRQKCKSSGC